MPDMIPLRQSDSAILTPSCMNLQTISWECACLNSVSWWIVHRGNLMCVFSMNYAMPIHRSIDSDHLLIE